MILAALTAAGWFLTVAAALVAVYFLFLAAAVLFLPAPPPRRDPPRTRFALLVPAHDEAAGIAATLDAFLAQEYPRELFEVVLVADNCSDATAAIGREKGVTVLERTDPEHRGKGFALAWAIPQVLARGADAVVVVDADCFLDPWALAAFDAHLALGREALQASNLGSNPDDSAASFALAVGNRLENDLFYAPKSALGLAVFLRGTGMVFSRALLESHPWNAHSLAEDAEYGLALLREGRRVHFVPEAAVRSALPADAGQMAVQRARWAGGNLALGRRQGLTLVIAGIFMGNLRMADAGATLLTLSRPLVLALAAAAVAVSALAAALGGGLVLLGAALGAAFLHAFHLTLGILKVGLTRRRLGYLLQSPGVVARLLVIALKGLAGGSHAPWARTPRREA